MNIRWRAVFTYSGVETAIFWTPFALAVGAVSTSINYIPAIGLSLPLASTFTRSIHDEFPLHVRYGREHDLRHRDAVELARQRRLFPLVVVAHLQQRHDGRQLHRRSSPRRVSRISTPREPRIRCLSATPVPAPTPRPTSRSRRRGARKLLRRAVHHARSPATRHLPGHCSTAARAVSYPRCYARPRLHRHVARHAFQRLHLHLHHPGRHSRQVPVRRARRPHPVQHHRARRQGRAPCIYRGSRANRLLCVEIMYIVCREMKRESQ